MKKTPKHINGKLSLPKTFEVQPANGKAYVTTEAAYQRAKAANKATPAKAKAVKKPSLAVTIAKMQKQAPVLTQKMDKLRARIAKLATAVKKHEQAEGELRNLMMGSGFATDYYDYVDAKEEEDRDTALKQKKA